MANILACHSLNQPALEAHVRLYRTIMFGDSPLSRTEREALAAAAGHASLAEAVASGAHEKLEPRLIPRSCRWPIQAVSSKALRTRLIEALRCREVLRHIEHCAGLQVLCRRRLIRRRPITTQGGALRSRARQHN
jgi:hypothetical protein